MKCSRCQQENAPQAKFCLECAPHLAMFREMGMRFWLDKAEMQISERP